MSERVDAVRNILNAFNRRDIDGMLALAHPDLEMTDIVDLPDAQTFRGHEGLRKYMERSLAPWETISFETERLIEVGDQVVAIGHNYGRGIGSGVDVVQARGQVYGFTDGRVARVRFFVDHATALEAAGTSKQLEQS